jgi:hypothetical protein
MHIDTFPSSLSKATKTFAHPPLLRGPGDEVVESVLREILVPPEVLALAKRRRDAICAIARSHPAARDYWHAGSIAQETENSPLGDADCGVMINRRFEEFRAYGPDAGPGGLGPENFIQSFAEYILPRIREAGYPEVTIDLSGNRAIKFDFHGPVDFDSLGEIDPSVDLIIGLERRDGPGVWIPNRRRKGWDPAHPQQHTYLMTHQGGRELVVHRAHVVRLSKRAIKRDAASQPVAAMCSWNVSALALITVRERAPIASALGDSLSESAASISHGLTEDPAGVAGPIKLPDGCTNERSAARLAGMAEVVLAASKARSIHEARQLLEPLFAVEIESIRSRERNRVRRNPLSSALRSGDQLAVGSALGAAGAMKPTRSHGA